MKPFSVIFALLLVASPVLAEVKLPSIISDHMLLQKSPKAALWGWADAGEEVKATIGPINGSTTAGADGRWRMEINTTNLTQGPYELTIAGRNTLAIKDVVIGEVWFCSGQSNMEARVYETTDGKAIAAQSTNPMIRHFCSKQTTSLKPMSDVGGKWEVASPTTTPAFTAVGYYFARHINATLGVPVGLINSTWGGTPIEAWTSFEGAEVSPDLKARRDSQIDAFVRMEETYQKYVKALEEWEAKCNRIDPGNKGEAAGWHKPEFDTSDWKLLPEGPSRFKLSGFKGGGAVWYRRKFELPAKAEEKPLDLILRGNIGNSVVYFNGHCIGHTTQETFKANYIRRYYRVPANLVKAGPVTVAIRYFSSGEDGGTENRYVLLQSTGEFFMTIENNWVAKPEFELPDLNAEQRRAQPSWSPVYDSGTATMLYNGMVAPLTPYTIAGVLWYQGEYQYQIAYHYRFALAALINDWRKQFNNPDMPFYICQLPNYGSKARGPVEGGWAELRESQLEAISLPHTGMAVLIDIGETQDVHPRNKLDVGLRLAAIALNQTYGQKNDYSGPIYVRMSIEGRQIRLHFKFVGEGLVARELPATEILRSADNKTAPLFVPRPGSLLQGFTICGTDRKWVWADAMIDGDTVVVSSPEVSQPVAVRYAWSDNPTCNLYNKAGFPASPFRTDDFPLVSQNKK